MSLMDRGFAAICQLARTLPASHPVLVHRLASLLHASFRPHLTVRPLRFAITSPPSGCEEDLHLPAVDHARHTTKDGHGCPVPLRDQPTRERFQHPTIGSLPMIIRSYKGAVTYHARRQLNRTSLQIWQSNYYERVLRDGKEFSHASRYIFENPTKWAAYRSTGHPCPSLSSRCL